MHGQPNALGPIGMVIASVLVTWAASYGIDEYGKEEDPLPRDGPELLAAVKKRREICNEMVRELLGRIDALGLLRRPSWDGVRVLLLIMPLTEGRGFETRLSPWHISYQQYSRYFDPPGPSSKSSPLLLLAKVLTLAPIYRVCISQQFPRYTICAPLAPPS